MKAFCFACKKELEEVNHNLETGYQFENALWVGFFGGYAMFVDNMDAEWGYEKRTLKGADYEASICHDCAHDLCDKVPWISELLQPAKSHSHPAEFWKENPDHEGWDKPKTS